MNGKLTAEQVREAIFNGSAYASYDGSQYYANGIDMQAIADELSAVVGDGECERVKHGTKPDGTPRYRCSVCGYGLGDYRWEYCPKCGFKIRKAVKR